MYNRILKRPMFRRGGPSYQSQGTGITSPYDIPRGGYYGGGTIGGGAIRGNPMGNRTGFVDPKWGADDTLEQIDIDTKKIFAPKEGEWSGDVMQYLSALSTPYKESGEAKTIGEMGAEGAAQVKLMRDERQEKRDLASLEGLQARKDKLLREEEQSFELNKLLKEFAHETGMQVFDRDTQVQIAQMAKDNTATGRRLTENDERLKEEMAAAASLPHPQDKAATAAAKAKHKKSKDRIIEGSNLEAAAFKIASEMVRNNPGGMKSIDEIMVDLIVLIKAIQAQDFRSGGRVGYQMGTPNTGAMPNQGSPNIMAQATTDTEVEDAYGVSVDQGIEGQQASVEMPYQEFRAAIPAEVSDEIVQLIYYNQDAFADFAQISTQADVYAFNNKYGVSLVLPMDTETT